MGKQKKLVDLGILQEDEATGVKKISLVEEPAIMIDFMYFNKVQKFVKPSAGESEDEFIGRCMSSLDTEFPDQDQRLAVCYNYWNEMDIDTSGLSPYVDQDEKEKKLVQPMSYEWLKDEYTVNTILKLAEELGTKEEDLATLFNMEFATNIANPSLGGAGTSPAEVVNKGDKKLYLYKYEGPISTNSRPFCVDMISLNRYYTKAQVKAMANLAVNPGFGEDSADTYSIWDYHGGPNCKHRFNQYLVEMRDGQIVGPTYVKPAVGKAGTPTYRQPNHGYISARHSAFKFASDEQQVLVGPAMIPSINIPRMDEDGDTYYVKFSEETIREIAMKYMKEARTVEVNTDHADNEAGAYVFESWLIEDPETDKANTKYGYNLPKGTWMVSMKVEDKATWERVKNGSLRGFSIEGILLDMEEIEAKKKYEKIVKILRD